MNKANWGVPTHLEGRTHYFHPGGDYADHFTLGVTGSRTLRSYTFINARLTQLTIHITKPILLVQGGQMSWEWRGVRKVKYGADYLAQQWAFANKHVVRTFHPDLEQYGSPAAYHIRNKEMMEHIAARRGVLVAFWDGVTAGTANTIELARKYLPEGKIRVIKFTQREATG